MEDLTPFEKLTGYRANGTKIQAQPLSDTGVQPLEDSPTRAHPPERKYPFPLLQVGEQVFVEAKLGTARSAACAYGARHKRRFRVRATSLDGKTGVTIQRLR